MKVDMFEVTTAEAHRIKRRQRLEKEVCQFPGCTTILHGWNKDHICLLHKRKLVLRDVEYIRGKFMKIISLHPIKTHTVLTKQQVLDLINGGRND